ncbi:MAG: alanine racemase [Lachnospiraceae bacterium]
MNMRAHIEVDLDMIEYNIDQMYLGMKGVSKLMAVVKTDAYGHGAVPIAKRLDANEQVIGFATATFEEAKELREAGITKMILILGYTFPYCYEELISYELIPTVYSYEAAKELDCVAKALGKTLEIHIKIDTGMGRIGIIPDEKGLELVHDIYELEHIRIAGIFTHFAKSDEVDKTHARMQLHSFLEFIDRLKKDYAMDIPYVHAANSAAIISMEDTRLSFSRAGIAMYGICPDEAMKPLGIDLKPVLQLYTHIIHLKEGVVGNTISYGGTYEVKRDMKIATIPIGYGDGYPRGLSNKGYVLIRGKKAPIIGRICMDQCMIDVTDIEGVSVMDQVTLIGTDGEEHISVEMLSEWSGVFHYELVCNLNKRVKRIAF